LEIPDIRKRVAPITVERYHRMIDLGVFDEWEVEILNGVLIEKISKSELHVFLVQLLYKKLIKFCPDSNFHIGKEDPITIGNSELEPDISAVEGTLTQYRRTKPTTAVFVIEVSITTVGVDRAKATAYASAGVPEYWLIRPEDDLTEVYRVPIDGEYTEMTEVPSKATLESSSLPGFSFNLAVALAE